jgi:hypothetical protein
MSNERQVAANRQNAQRSTGPRTANGKARVAFNALKHGLTGKQVVLPNESSADFDTFREGLFNALAPHDELEGILAEKIVIDAWRLRRVPLLESALYRRGLQELIEDEEQEVQYGHAHADALAKLTESRSKLSAEMTVVFQNYPGTFTNLSRHEAALSRSFLRNLHELQRLQAVRRGERVEAPAVVDVNLNIIQDGSVNPEGILQNKPILKAN